MGTTKKGSGKKSTPSKHSAESHPHDHTFHFLMGHAVFYMAFFRCYLPQHVQKQLDWNTLEPVLPKFAGPRSLRDSDIVFRCQFLNDGGWIYFAVEAQSSNDDTMDWRCYQYETGIVQFHLEEFGKTDQRPPVVWSLVVYTGKKPWNSPLNVLDRLQPAIRRLAEEALHGPALLVNWREPMQIIQESQEPLLDATRLLMHHAYAPNPAEILTKLMPLLQQVGELPKGRLLLNTLLNYAVRNDGSDGQKHVMLLIDELEHAFRDSVLGEELMSIAAAWKQQGEQIGIQKGEQIGIQKGEQIGIQKGEQLGVEKSALGMLQEGMGLEVIARITHLSMERLRELAQKLEHKLATRKR